jgi:hypothetical protein
MRKVAPKIADTAHAWYAENSNTVNQGVTYALEAWPGLYRATLTALKGRFAAAELSLMIDVLNGVLLTPEFAGQHLPADVADAVALDGLDRKWGVDGVDFQARLNSLAVFEVACLELWAHRFWESGRADVADGLENWVKILA